MLHFLGVAMHLESPHSYTTANNDTILIENRYDAHFDWFEAGIKYNSNLIFTVCEDKMELVTVWYADKHMPILL